MRLRLVLILGLLASAGDVSAKQGLYRFPTIAGDSVVFTAEGDLWSAPLTGGGAARLTSHPGQEIAAAASPNGRQIAFNASYDGPEEIYVMPIGGGSPKRLTFEGDGLVLGWTPSGEVLYRTQNPTGPALQRMIVAVDPVSLARRTLPLVDVSEAAMSADGGTLFFSRLGLQAIRGDNARGYRGGLQAQLWRFDLKGDNEATPIPGGHDANERSPMVWGDRLYFLSDASGRDNVWSMKPDGGDRRAETRESDFDVRNPRLHEGKLIYQLGADLKLRDLVAGGERLLSIDLLSDFDQLRSRQVNRAVEGFFESARFAPPGDRIAVTSRGQVIIAGLAPLRQIRVNLPEETRARFATPAHDGKAIFAVLDGPDLEPEIWRLAADGSPERRQLTTDAAPSRTGLSPDPTGKFIAHATADGRAFLLDLATLENRVIDQGEHPWHQGAPSLIWTPDGKTLAITRPDANATRNQIFLYDLASRTLRRLTSHRYNSVAPTFAPDGRWLYFLSDRTFNSAVSSPWGDRNFGPYFDKRTKLYALALQPGNRFPFKPKDELSGAEPAARKPGESGGTPAIDYEGLADRLFEAPLPAGNYVDLAMEDRRLYLLERADAENFGRHVLKTLSIDNNDPKPEEYLDNVRGFALSADRKSVFVRRWASGAGPGDFLILPAGAKAPRELDKARVPLAELRFAISPQREWRQMFADAWRMHRDLFHDPSMRGVDWPAMRAKYAPLIDRVSDRAELDAVLAQMVSELGALHSQIRVGQMRAGTDGAQRGFLGGTFAAEPDGLRILRIYQAERELPDRQGPMSRPGVNLRVGDLITAINGLPTAGLSDPGQILDNQARQQVLLTVSRAGATVGAVVTPVDMTANAALRYGDWEISRRDRVEQAGQGRIGYLHLRAMARDDIGVFAREFYAQSDRDGLIIDVRSNNGGNIDSWIIEKLLRRAWSYWAPRDGKDRPVNMQNAFLGHIALLIDERTYSDGEVFAAGMQRLNLATLIGRRTAGAGVWLNDANLLVDRGIVRAARWGLHDMLTGSLLIEGVGVTPDIEILNPPHAAFKGEDAQLDKAIELLTAKIASSPVKRP